MLIPRILAFNAVQRQIAASRSKSPPSTVQQCGSGGVPMTAPTGPLSTLAHTPSFRASLGQCPLDGLGFGFGNWWIGTTSPATTYKVKEKNVEEQKESN
ncbi:hypothetical protein H5410_043469 [Solanum commersonii]|uniref:Uncharacterized protein n=1 Tax=Solanum commersonii TaxID=4109 RepID=A0A9J5XX91_SOLCO|nr:hypothetical protein H5410_043469 [Solanum commersonii]